jgi:hypothetical protein
MNRTSHTRSAGVEAGLERSLRQQVSVPKLDDRFNSAVWARIAAEEQRVKAPLARGESAAVSRWMLAMNGVGIAVTVVLVVVFGVRMFSGVDVSVELPRLPVDAVVTAFKLAGWAIAGAALTFGLMFTPLGRRMRNELR